MPPGSTKPARFPGMVPAAGCAAAEVPRLVAALECGSDHPLDEAVVRGSEARQVSVSDARDFAATLGNGVSDRVDERQVLLGNAELLRDRRIDFRILQPAWERLAADGQRPMTA